MMNKIRIEALSDGVFSIVMTLLIIDIKVPQLMQPHNGYELMNQLWKMWPLFRSYYVSFAILGMYWIAHHALFHLFAKHANRPITYLNILFLCFIALIPFSAHLIGQYPLNEVAVAVYGFNVIVIGIVQYCMMRITLTDPQILHEGATDKLITQAMTRMLMPPAFAVLGIITGFFHSSISFFLFAFPVIFNIMPGSLNAIDAIFLKISSKK
jgi:uncharacterized membrane protein